MYARLYNLIWVFVEGFFLTENVYLQYYIVHYYMHIGPITLFPSADWELCQ